MTDERRQFSSDEYYLRFLLVIAVFSKLEAPCRFLWRFIRIRISNESSDPRVATRCEEGIRQHSLNTLSKLTAQPSRNLVQNGPSPKADFYWTYSIHQTMLILPVAFVIRVRSKLYVVTAFRPDRSIADYVFTLKFKTPTFCSCVERVEITSNNMLLSGKTFLDADTAGSFQST